MALEYVTTEPSKTADAPDIEVKAAAIRPPVQDSAKETVWFCEASFLMIFSIVL